MAGSADGRRSLYIVVPVFNEVLNLERLFDGLREAARESSELDVSIVLVDDGSTDGTSDAARVLAGELELTVLRHDTNRGPGYAFGTAFAHLTSIVREDDLVVTMEGDNTSRNELISSMIRRSEEGQDAVFASPYAYGGGILHTSSLRVFLSHVANAFVKEFLGVRGILTVSSFFRLYRGASLHRLQACYGERIVERNGFESMVELVMKMVNLRMSISEVPMVLDGHRRVGPSKLNTRRTILGYFALLGRRREWRRRAAA